MKFAVNPYFRYDDLTRIIHQEIFCRKFIESKGRSHNLIKFLIRSDYPSYIRGKLLAS